MPRLRRSSSFCTCTHGDAVGYPVVAPPALGLVVISVLTVRSEGLLHRLVLNSLLMVKIFVKEYGLANPISQKHALRIRARSKCPGSAISELELQGKLAPRALAGWREFPFLRSLEGQPGKILARSGGIKICFCYFA
jgi:hypothetical protein